MDGLFSNLIDDHIPLGHRKTALALVGLNGKDRIWILSRLSDLQQQTLAPLIDELTALGFAESLQGQDVDLIDSIAKMVDEYAASALPSSILDTLYQASVDDILSTLLDEPAEIRAVLLAAQPWPWRDIVLQQLPYICDYNKLLEESPALTSRMLNTLLIQWRCQLQARQDCCEET